MSDVSCPYCKHEQEINHDDGYGYEDGEEFEQECTNCDEPFKFTTDISFSYSVYCDGDHEMAHCGVQHLKIWNCKKCDFCEVRRDE